MKSEFLIAVTQLAAERNLPKELVLSAIEAALASAYKKDSPSTQNITVKISPTTGDLRVYAIKTIVETITDQQNEIALAEARKIKSDAKIGDQVDVETTTPANAGRIAAQTAKQVVMQRLREAERDLIYAEFSTKEGDAVNGTVQRVEGKSVIVDLGRAEAVLPPQEQVPSERYRAGQRMKFYLLEVGKTPKGPQIVVSRTHKNLVRRLFEIEVPEIHSGAIEIKSMAREAGFRSKVAVFAKQDGVDAVGSCVGHRGIRIQNIVNELHGEKIDVVEWHRDPNTFIAKALGPAQVLGVTTSAAEATATVVVPDRQLSLAIGKEGQNARLAAKLTGWRIDIKSATQAEADRLKAPPIPVPATLPRPEEPATLAVPTPQPAVQPAAASLPPPTTPAEQARPAILGPLPAAAQVTASGAPAQRQEGVPLPAAPTSADTWSVERIVREKPQIRFAEDILARGPARGPVPEDRGRPKKGKRVGPETEGDSQKAKKGRKEKPALEDYEDENLA